MRLLLAVWLAKLSGIAGRLIGKKSSSTPGSIALKLCPDLIKILSKNIKQIRKNLNMTQEVFAAMVGISEEELSLIERKKVKDIKLSTIQKIAAFTDLTVAELLGDNPDENGKKNFNVLRGQIRIGVFML